MHKAYEIGKAIFAVAFLVTLILGCFGIKII